MKEYIGNCTQFKARRVNEIEDKSIKCSKKLFMEKCNLDNFDLYDLNLKNHIKKYPNDFKFYKTKDDKIYWFSHSSIFYFFKEELI